MRMFLSMYRPRGDIEPMVERAVRVRALGAQCNTIVAVAKGGDELVTGGMMTRGGWR